MNTEKLINLSFNEIPKDKVVKLYPGDIIKTCTDEIGVVVNAHFDDSVRWYYSEVPVEIECAQYALQDIPGFPKLSYLAWWDHNQITHVVKGPLHLVLD